MMSEGGMEDITVDDAFAYLKKVKDVFQDKREEYDYFMTFMKDFREKRFDHVEPLLIDYEGVVARVKELFKEHTDLISGFNTFLPDEYQIKLPLEEQTSPPRRGGYEAATKFVKKVKTRFHGNDHVYRSFLDIMNTLSEEKKSITEAYKEVTALFQGHEDFLDELKQFFPGTSGAAFT